MNGLDQSFSPQMRACVINLIPVGPSRAYNGMILLLSIQTGKEKRVDADRIAD